METPEYVQYALAISALVIIPFIVWKIKSLKETKKQTPKSQSNSDKSNEIEQKVQEQKVVPKIETIKKKIRIKTSEQLQQQYSQIFHNSFRIKPNKSIHNITAICLVGSKLLFADSKNDLVLMDLKKIRKNDRKASDEETSKTNQNSGPERYFVNLDNNTATAVAIGKQFYYAALNFDRTIVYYEFKGGEGGVYFQEVCKFPRNILKSSAGSLWVSEQEKYLVTTGFDADTIIDVWSMKGQKLNSVNTYQIQQYQFSYGIRDIIVRGWTSEAKIFTFTEQKDGNFKNIQKKMHIAHDESPLCCVMDNLTMYALSITKNSSLRLWPLHKQFLNESHQTKFIQYTNDENSEQYIEGLNKCIIYSQQYLLGHFKTLIIAASDKQFIILDRNFNLLRKVSGIECQQLQITGGKKSVVMGIMNKKGQVYLWNLTEQIEQCQQLKL